MSVSEFKNSADVVLGKLRRRYPRWFKTPTP
jgi:hypothetical protein